MATDDTQELLYAVQDGGQLITEGDKLRIGVGNIRRDSDGTNNDISVGLWFFFADEQEDQQQRAREGDVIEIHGYSIRVAEINRDDAVVVLGITYPDAFR